MSGSEGDFQTSAAARAGVGPTEACVTLSYSALQVLTRLLTLCFLCEMNAPQSVTDAQVQQCSASAHIWDQSSLVGVRRADVLGQVLWDLPSRNLLLKLLDGHALTNHTGHEPHFDLLARTNEQNEYKHGATVQVAQLLTTPPPPTPARMLHLHPLSVVGWCSDLFA